MSRDKHEPTQAAILDCMHNMSMSQLKDPKNGIFLKMPKSIVVHGLRIPRTALRKEDLCKLYLQLGGTVTTKPRPTLKHFKPSKKPGPEQRKYEKLLEQRSLDHHGPQSKKHQSARASSLKTNGVALSNRDLLKNTRSPIVARSATARKSGSLKKRSSQEIDMGSWRIVGGLKPTTKSFSKQSSSDNVLWRPNSHNSSLLQQMRKLKVGENNNQSLSKKPKMDNVVKHDFSDDDDDDDDSVASDEDDDEL